MQSTRGGEDKAGSPWIWGGHTKFTTHQITPPPKKIVVASFFVCLVGGRFRRPRADKRRHWSPTDAQ